jgi:hypothetical protein
MATRFGVNATHQIPQAMVPLTSAHVHFSGTQAIVCSKAKTVLLHIPYSGAVNFYIMFCILVSSDVNLKQQKHVSLNQNLWPPSLTCQLELYPASSWDRDR